jgi:lipid-binding SYLF domain-containing protein
MTETKRPDRTSMQGMIWNAHHILERTLDGKKGLDPGLFGESLVGICFISCVQAGFMFTGNVGTGIVMARNNGKWSPPSAIGLTGVGWGFVIGASVQDIIYLIYDDQTLKAMSGDVGFKLGTKVESALGTWGRTAEATTNFSNKGVGANIAISFSKGLFGGLSVEGGVVNPRSAVNEMFYQKSATPMQILFDEGAVEVPPGTLMDEVYHKLNKLIKGDITHTPTAEELAKIEATRIEAEKTGAEAAKSSDVVHVDAAVEAAKEAANK